MTIDDNTPDATYYTKYSTLDFQPIFIMGVQRSGTSILYKILNETATFNIVTAYHLIKFSELIYNHEKQIESEIKRHLMETLSKNMQQDRGIDRLQVTPDFPEEYGFLLTQKTNSSKLTPKGVSYFKALCQKIQFITDTNKPLLLKNPFDFANVVFIKKQFPNAKFIFIHRNPLKTLNSQIKATQTLLDRKSPYMALLSPEYNHLFEHHITLAYYRFLYSDKTPLRLHSAVKNLKQQTTQLLHDISKIPSEDYIDITYEQLCIEPKKCVENIMQFLTYDINNNPDYPKLIAPRTTKWLPEISKNKEKILTKLQPYLDYCKYQKESLMQV